MGYRLRQDCPEYSPMDGECAGRRYEHGMEYAEIPAGDADKFDNMQEQVKPASFGRKVEKTEKPAEKPVGGEEDK